MQRQRGMRESPGGAGNETRRGQTLEEVSVCSRMAGTARGTSKRGSGQRTPL